MFSFRRTSQCTSTIQIAEYLMSNISKLVAGKSEHNIFRGLNGCRGQNLKEIHDFVLAPAPLGDLVDITME